MSARQSPQKRHARQALLVVFTVGFMTAGPLATKATQTSQGLYAYEPVSVVLLAELLKFLFSTAAYACHPHDKRTHHLLSRRDVAHYAIPAAVYCANNVLLFFIMQHIQPSAFQLLSQLKVIFTAVMVRLLLDRQLNMGHYLALLSLALGAAVSRLPKQNASNAAGGSDDPHRSSTSTEWYGVLLTVVSCLASSVGGVLNEKMLKKDGDIHSVHLANSILYFYGILLNSVLLSTRCVAQQRSDPFSNYNGQIILLVLLTTATGLSISFLLKWLDNLVRVLAHSCAMLLSMTVEVVMLSAMPSPQLVLAVGIVGVSAAQYAREGTPCQRQTTRRMVMKERETEDEACTEAA